MRVLVTGGDGFIGSHVVEALADRGDEVLSIDALLPGTHDDSPATRDPRAEYRQADVRDADAVREAVRGVDSVVHQASMVGLAVDFSDVTGCVSHNDLGTAVLLGALHERGFTGELVLASSMVVYGEGRYRCERDGVAEPGVVRTQEDLGVGRYDPPCPACGGELTPEAVPEDARLDPRNVYAATKVHQEHLCSANAREHGARVIALRYHNVYGPRMARDTPYAGVASIFRSALERGEPPLLFEDGEQIRNFVNVRDVARANVLALGSDARGAFNIASTTPKTVGQMAEALVSACGTGVPSHVVVGGARLGDVRHVFASPVKAKKELGFEATVSFEDGMVEFAALPLRGSVIHGA